MNKIFPTSLKKVTNLIESVKSWCIETFSCKSHKHTTSDIENLEIGIPDYNSPIEITTLPFTCTHNGVVIAYPKWTGNGGARYVYLTPKGSDVKYGWLVQVNASESGQNSAGQIIVREGDIISANTTSVSSFNQLTLFPFA